MLAGRFLAPCPPGLDDPEDSIKLDYPIDEKNQQGRYN
jgi:hypothetical protein